jgi:hypothetical protein
MYRRNQSIPGTMLGNAAVVKARDRLSDSILNFRDVANSSKPDSSFADKLLEWGGAAGLHAGQNIALARTGSGSGAWSERLCADTGGAVGAGEGVERERSEAMKLNDDDVVAWTFNGQRTACTVRIARLMLQARIPIGPPSRSSTKGSRAWSGVRSAG